MLIHTLSFFYIYKDVEVMFSASCNAAFSYNILYCGITDLFIVETMLGVLHISSFTMNYSQ